METRGREGRAAAVPDRGAGVLGAGAVKTCRLPRSAGGVPAGTQGQRGWGRGEPLSLAGWRVRGVWAEDRAQRTVKQ